MTSGLSPVEVNPPDYSRTSVIGRFDDNVKIVVKGLTFRGGEIRIGKSSSKVKTVDVLPAVRVKRSRCEERGHHWAVSTPSHRSRDGGGGDGRKTVHHREPRTHCSRNEEFSVNIPVLIAFHT